MSQCFRCIAVVDNQDVSLEINTKFFALFKFDRHSLSSGINYSPYHVETYSIKSKKALSESKTTVFLDFLKEKKVKILFSQSGSTEDKIFVKVFAINLKKDLFKSIRKTLINQIEKVLGKKLKIYNSLYYFSLSSNDSLFAKKKEKLSDLISYPPVLTVSSFENSV